MFLSGGKLLLDLLYDTGVSVDSYYKLDVTNKARNALRKQIIGKSNDYLRAESLDNMTAMFSLIELYQTSINKGCEYTLAYLDAVKKDGASVNECFTINSNAFEQIQTEAANKYRLLHEV